MSTLSNPPAPADDAVWVVCAGCGVLFPAAPDQDRCQVCVTAPATSVRCESAHPEDRSACEGPPGAVRVVDRVGDELCGCVHHASVVLASVEGSRVYPGSVAGAAIEAFTRAQLREPFVFDPVGPWPAAHPSGGER